MKPSLSHSNPVLTALTPTLHLQADIKEHPFFLSVDWDLLERKEIKPPFDPHVKDHLDLRHFDPQFTNQNVPTSLMMSPQKLSVSVADADDEFFGFTYTQRSYEDDDE